MLRRRRTWTWIAGIAMIVAGVVAYFYADLSGDQRARILADLSSLNLSEDELARLSTPELRIRWFTEIHRIDPIFAIEGTDPVALEKAVDRLYGGLRDIAALYSRAERTLILTSLHPMAFLTALPRTESLRLQTQSYPSLVGAIRYSVAALHTITRYISDTIRFEMMVRTAVPAEAQYASFGGTATRDSMIRAIRIARADAEDKRRETARRMRCALYFSRTCASLDDALGRRLASIRSIPAVEASGPMPIPFALEMVQAQNPTSLLPPVRINSACAPVSSNQPLYLFQKPRHPREGEGLAVTTADDLFLLDQDALTTYRPPPDGPDNPESDPSYRYNMWVSAQGIRYIYGNAGAMYLCLDAGKDVTALNGMHAVYAWLRDHGDAPGADRILNAPLLKHDDVAALVAEAVSVTPRDTHAVAAMFLQGSSRFDTIIQGVRYDSVFPRAFAKHGSHVPLEFLIATRSHPSILFLTSNPSFSPRDPTFYALHQRHPMESLRRTTYHTLLEAGEDRAWLEQHIRDSLTFMTNDTDSLYTQ